MKNKKNTKTKGNNIDISTKEISTNQPNNNILAADNFQQSLSIDNDCLNCKYDNDPSILSIDFDTDAGISKYIDGLVDGVWDDINTDKFSIEPARIGYDMKDDSECEVYDYDLMFNILTSNGYCPECADTFIEAMSWCKDDNKNPQFMFVRRKELGQIKYMFSKYLDSLQKKVKSDEVKSSKKKITKKSK